MAVSPADEKASINRACQIILKSRWIQPQIAIVLGSGLGGLADRVQHPCILNYDQIDGFPRTHASGHQGRLITGFLAGLPVVMMQGRTHRYEGYSDRNVRFPVQVMHGLGAQLLITTNAAGGLNPRFQVADLMVIDSHLDFLWTRGAISGQVKTHPGIRGQKECYDSKLVQRAKLLAKNMCLELHQGCYIATLGPTFETRSEYRMFRRFGGDAVGMSTVPEVLMAQQLSMRVLGFSVITNVASTDIPQSTTHHEVVSVGDAAGPRLMSIIMALLDEMAGQPD
ncbi:MAG: purine-nucleoside phosphorylase [Planctomycetales bacterium]|nr:purine-nucleoside phosphorylase [Planctomycetales bacterium]